MAPQYRQRYRYNPYGGSRQSTMMAATPTDFKARNGRSNGGYKSRSGGRRGPYQALTQYQSHTHPVYPKPEVKTSDIDQAGVIFTVPSTTPSAITTAGTVIVLNALAQGGPVNQRIGQQVSTRNLTYRYELDLPAAPNAVPTSGRVMIVWDRQPNGTTAAFTDIFTDASYLAFVEPGSAQRFVILRNKQFSLSPNGDQTIFEEGFIKINMTSTYGTASTTPVSGAILLVFIGDQTTAANRPVIAGCFRTRFIDN